MPRGRGLAGSRAPGEGCLGRQDADIEDLLGDDVYVKVVAGTYGLKPIKMKSLTSKHPRIAKRIEEEFANLGAADGTHFSHLDPANYLREHKDFVQGMIEASVAATVKLFETLNALVS